MESVNKCDLIIVPYAEVGQLFAWRGINTRKVIVPLGVDTSKFECYEIQNSCCRNAINVIQIESVKRLRASCLPSRKRTYCVSF